MSAVIKLLALCVSLSLKMQFINDKVGEQCQSFEQKLSKLGIKNFAELAIKKKQIFLFSNESSEIC